MMPYYEGFEPPDDDDASHEPARRRSRRRPGPGTKDRCNGCVFDTGGIAVYVGPIGNHNTPYTFGRVRAYIAAQYTLWGQAALLKLRTRFGERGPMDRYDPAD